MSENTFGRATIFTLQILLDACKKCGHFEDIFKKIRALRNVMRRAFRNAKVGSNITSIICIQLTIFSRLKFAHNHLLAIINDKKQHSLLILFSARDVVNKINIQEIVNEWIVPKHWRVKV